MLSVYELRCVMNLCLVYILSRVEVRESKAQYYILVSV